ncbi:zinc-binding dehydrogenase [Nonomuraea sp. NPDC059023]
MRAEIDGVLPLEQAAEAHRRGETGRTTGELVLAVANETGTG